MALCETRWRGRDIGSGHNSAFVALRLKHLLFITNFALFAFVRSCFSSTRSSWPAWMTFRMLKCSQEPLPHHPLRRYNERSLCRLRIRRHFRRCDGVSFVDALGKAWVNSVERKPTRPPKRHSDALSRCSHEDHQFFNMFCRMSLEKLKIRPFFWKGVWTWCETWELLLESWRDVRTHYFWNLCRKTCEKDKHIVTASLFAQQVFFWDVHGSGIRVDFRFSARCQLAAQAENLERRHLWSQTLKNWSRWTRQNSTPEGSMQRKC